MEELVIMFNQGRNLSLASGLPQFHNPENRDNDAKTLVVRGLVVLSPLM